MAVRIEVHELPTDFASLGCMNAQNFQMPIGSEPCQPPKKRLGQREAQALRVPGM